MHIGDFAAFEGAQRELEREKDDFTFAGETFVVQCPMPAVLMLQLGASVSGKVDETEGFAALWEALRVSLTIPEVRRDYDATVDGPDVDVDEHGTVLVSEADDEPFRKLYKLAVDRGVKLEPMMKLVMALFEAQTGTPTRRASVSSDGRPNTSPSSSTSSTHPGLSHLRPVSEVVTGGAPFVQPSQIPMADGQMAEVEYSPIPGVGPTG